MASRFLGKTPLAGLEPLTCNGRAVLGEYTRLQAVLRQHAPQAAELLAEPIVTWGGTGTPGVVSWYTEAQDDPQPLSALPVDRRALVEAQLRATLGEVAPLLRNPDIGALLQRALVLASPAGIQVVDGRIVLTDWGLATSGTVPPGGTRDLANTPLGGYLRLPSAPEPAHPVAPPGGGVGTAATAPPAAPAMPPHRATPPPPPAFMAAAGPAAPVRNAWNWWLVPTAALLAGLFLIFGLWLGAKLTAERVAERPSTVSMFDETAVRAALERQREQNAALEREIEQRRLALQGNVCVADPALLPRVGPDRAQSVPPAGLPRPSQGGPPFQGNIAALLTQAVVLVVSQQADGIGTGSGFFISPELIVTNRHVVEGAQAGKVVVVGGALSRASPAEVLAQSPDSTIGGLDVAILRVRGVPNVQPLALSTLVAPLDPVIAAGFPSLTMRGDEAFTRLMSGDGDAVPQVILTDGRINAIQTSPSGGKVMPHSAAVSGGNSGGPLVDACGRVVGINTYIAADRQQVAHANFAQKIDAIIEFLKANGATATVRTDACSPAAPTPPPAGSPAPAPR